MLIFTQKITPRLKYSCNVVFKHVLKSDVSITQDEEEFLKYNGPKLNYSKSAFDNIPQVIPTDLLFEKDIFEQDIHLFFWDELPAFFKVRGNAIIPMDIFAATFYLVSRYEEYLPFVPDNHGRFTAKESLAFRKGFLKMPLINLWCLKLEESLLNVFPDWKREERAFSFITTIDVDNIFAYRGKGAFRTIGGVFKDLSKFDISNLIERVSCLTKRKKDPFDTFDFQMSLHKKYNVKSIYFMLFSEFARFDRNVSMYHPQMKATAKHFGDYTTIGIHPSYQSNSSRSILEKEKSTLETIMGKAITQSRQHFLKLTLPSTIRNLSNLGIKEEFTMGYARDVGFRASICTPVPFYDLELEVEMDIIIKPFAFMDMSFILYKNSDTSIAWEEIQELIANVKKVDGELISVWHNRTFSEFEESWKGWNNIYEKLLKEVSSNQYE